MAQRSTRRLAPLPPAAADAPAASYGGYQASTLQHGASRRHPLLSPAAQRRATEAALQLRQVLRASASAPSLGGLADPAYRLPRTPILVPDGVAGGKHSAAVLPPRPTCLPPLTEAASLPDAAAAAAAALEPTPSEGEASDAGDAGSVGDYSDAEGAATYTACFWPLHVWKRSTAEATTLERRLTSSLFEGMSRLRAFRRMRQGALFFATCRDANARLAARQRRRHMRFFVRQLKELAKLRRAYDMCMACASSHVYGVHAPVALVLRHHHDVVAAASLACKQHAIS